VPDGMRVVRVALLEGVLEGFGRQEPAVFAKRAVKPGERGAGGLQAKGCGTGPERSEVDRKTPFVCKGLLLLFASRGLR
jgi:hypothetical protein